MGHGPATGCPAQRFITARFDKENLRTMAAPKEYAEAQSIVTG